MACRASNFLHRLFQVNWMFGRGRRRVHAVNFDRNSRSAAIGGGGDRRGRAAFASEDKSVKGDILSVGVHLANLAWVALRSLIGTILVLTSAGIVLAVLSYFCLYESDWRYASFAAALVIMESMIAGFVLGMKRAMIMSVAHGLGTLRLGRSVVQLVFTRMLGAERGGEIGERGGQISRSLERLPLADAEELLGGAVRNLTGGVEQAGWLRRKIQMRLLAMVQKFTLARFREEGAKHGGIDLLKVQEELEKTVDEALVRKVRAGLWLGTALALIGLPLVVALQTWLVVMMLHAKG